MIVLCQGLCYLSIYFVVCCKASGPIIVIDSGDILNISAEYLQFVDITEICHLDTNSISITNNRLVRIFTKFDESEAHLSHKKSICIFTK